MLAIGALPALDPRLCLRAAPRARFPLDRLGQPGAHLFYLARAGVHQAVHHLLGQRPKVVLMPAYHHGVEVEAVRATGARVVFYRVDEQMRIDLEHVERQARRSQARLLYLIHYAGFAQPIEEARLLARHLDLSLLEDCALTLFGRTADGRPLGSFGDAALFCLYKTLPVPHGGLLLANGLSPPVLAAPPLASTLHHATGLVLAHLESHGGAVGRLLGRGARSAAHVTVDRLVENQQTGTQHLRPIELSLGASSLVRPIIRRIDGDQVVAQRRHNFQRLAEGLDGVVPVQGAPLPPGACPLFAPVRLRNKREVMRGLTSMRIESIDFWSEGDPACDLDLFPEVAALRREVLELPCHQDLDDDAIDHLARAVKQVLAHA